MQAKQVSFRISFMIENFDIFLVQAVQSCKKGNPKTIARDFSVYLNKPGLLAVAIQCNNRTRQSV